MITIITVFNIISKTNFFLVQADIHYVTDVNLLDILDILSTGKY